MRRLVLASYDKIMLKINAVIMLQKRGDQPCVMYALGLDLGDKNHIIRILDGDVEYLLQNCLFFSKSDYILYKCGTDRLIN